MTAIEKLKEEIKLKRIELKWLCLLERAKNLKFSELKHFTYHNGKHLRHHYEITKNSSHVSKYRVRLVFLDKKHSELLKEPNFEEIIVEKYKNRINKLKP
jgi:hypothetical protein